MGFVALETDEVTSVALGAAIEVHRHLGPGLLESVYQRCLARELWLRGMVFEEQVSIPLSYKGIQVLHGYRVDFRIAGAVLLELKACEAILPVHEAQMITYLRLTELETGLLINFNVPQLRRGVRRLLRKAAGRN